MLQANVVSELLLYCAQVTICKGCAVCQGSTSFTEPHRSPAVASPRGVQHARRSFTERTCRRVAHQPYRALRGSILGRQVRCLQGTPFGGRQESGAFGRGRESGVETPVVGAMQDTGFRNLWLTIAARLPSQPKLPPGKIEFLPSRRLPTLDSRGCLRAAQN